MQLYIAEQSPLSYVFKVIILGESGVGKTGKKFLI
jgi:hypothetical protein